MPNSSTFVFGEGVRTFVIGCFLPRGVPKFANGCFLPKTGVVKFVDVCSRPVLLKGLRNSSSGAVALVLLKAARKFLNRCSHPGYSKSYWKICNKVQSLSFSKSC